MDKGTNALDVSLSFPSAEHMFVLCAHLQGCDYYVVNLNEHKRITLSTNIDNFLVEWPTLELFFGTIACS